MADNQKGLHPIKKVKEFSIRNRVKLHLVNESKPLSESPLVIILGFNGSKLQHLNKFVTFYHTKGFDVITFTPTARDTYSFLSNDLVGLELWKLIAKLCSTHSRAIFFHVFSGSVYPFYRMMYLYQKKLLPESLFKQLTGVDKLICGIIFDSTPLDPTKENASNAVVINFPNWTYYLLYPPLKYSIRFYWYLTHDHDEWRNLFWNTLENPLNNAPHLVFFSLDDPITIASSVQNFIERMKLKKLKIEELCWKNSKHVNHFKAYPVQYCEKLDAFFKRQP